jgi:ATP-dependent DNA helicase DinG
MWPEPVILVATESVQQRLLRVEIPPLQQWLQTNKGIRTGDRWPNPDFQGLLLTTPEAWLAAQLENRGEFPSGIPTLIDGVDDLEDWTRTQLTATIQPSHWDDLMLACPDQVEAIRDARVQLTRAVFQHPANPYECYLISLPEQKILRHLYERLEARGKRQEAEAATHLYLPDAWRNFWQRFQIAESVPRGYSPQSIQEDEQLLWATIARSQGSFSLYCAPVDVASALSPIWSKQPVVLIGSALDQEAEAPIYRQRLGLSDLTCLKFSADRHSELIQLYLPDKLPLPNTPQFQAAFVEKVHSLLCLRVRSSGLTVILVGDMPLRSQVGAILAAEFGSRVQVEKTCLDDNGILVTGWEFWRQQQGVLPAPELLVIATLPLPSLENPLVAGRVACYKRSRQDWFRLYLLPAALSELQRAIAPVRERQGVVALLDSRVLHRSYGSQVLAALGPLARINYLDASLFSQSSNSNSESIN